MAPEAEYTFTLPSVADDTVLSCKVYHPKELRLGSTVKGAVLAHPYAPLGGSQADSVVVAVVTALLKQGHVVGTFDFRLVHDLTSIHRLDYLLNCHKRCWGLRGQDYMDWKS